MFFPECHPSSDEEMEEELQTVVHNFFCNADLPSRTAEDPREFMLTAAADYLARELTDDEVKELSMSDLWHRNRRSQHAVLQRHDVGPSCLVVEIPGSQSRKAGTSQINKIHKAWILEHVGNILDSGLTGLGENSGKPVNILVIALYRAQVTELLMEIKSLINQGRFSKDILTRLKVKTLDDAQGDEADIVFVDYVAVNHPGFTAESFRGTLALTRARGMTILLLNRGTFVGYERREESIERSNHLFRIYNWHASRQLVQRFSGCLHYEILDHVTSECKGAVDYSTEEVCEHPSCGKKGHNAATCPTRRCI
ncbi:hypothetical protein CDV36_014676 [Fusarium kuroshium]|uniref:DNA2/NAM7 helicase-like C-terminal domain-containing protein n=1 Tax=Fusarium kuroshium TaxID=2010991 RepID=A0A3M2RHC8_9HYPO|nr:hypothetical protein CDV36_014676 [Fusarium kuroshium]